MACWVIPKTISSEPALYMLLNIMLHVGDHRLQPFLGRIGSVNYLLINDLLVLFCRWSEMLSPGPGNLCLESSKAIKHDLWQNQLWLKRKAEAARQADSDEDDTEQFGIQEGNAEGTTIVAEFAGAPADDDEDEGDAYPLYGQDDSDFGDTGSDVRLAF